MVELVKKGKTAKTAKSRLPKNVIFVGKFRHQLERLHKMTYIFDFFHKNHILEIINFSLDSMTLSGVAVVDLLNAVEVQRWGLTTKKSRTRM